MIKILGDNVRDNIRISKQKNISAKHYVPNWPEEVFVIKNVKALYHGHVLLEILKVKKVVESFMKKNCKKHIKKRLELRK